MSGPIERYLGGLASTDPDRNPWVAYDFCRIDLPAPNGVIRLTNFPQGYVGNIDGSGVQTWIHSHVAPDGITWSDQRPEDVSWVELWNFDNVWSTILLNYDLEFKPIQLWQAHFNPTTKALLGQPQMWKGRTDKCDITGGIIRISLVPDRSTFSVEAPWVTVGPTCQNVFKEGFSCQYAAIAKPGTLTLTQVAGTQLAGTYAYSVTALHGIEETDASTGSLTITGSHAVQISWAAVPGATAYNVYGRAAGDQKIILVGQQITATTFTDPGTGRGTATPPVANGTGVATSCDHTRGTCQNLGNLIHRNAWDTVLNPSAVLWRTSNG